ncbi:MAG: nucleoside deaminase [Chitinophagaceae bacterium]|nr:nucleoside deaminase [Chitinophagaceae bacterium]
MTDEHFMQQALKEARKAYDDEEIPIGAIIVMNDRIIARGYNQTEKLTDSTAHAEIIALTSAFNFLGSKYLPEASIYITVEPCLMCAGALYWSKIGRVVFGADDEKNGYRRGIHLSSAAPTAINGTPEVYTPGWPFHPKTTLVKGILKEECAALMQDFFRERRR